MKREEENSEPSLCRKTRRLASVLLPMLTVFAATFSTSASAAAPIVTTEPATEVASESAVLNASVNPSGLQTTYQFEYGAAGAEEPYEAVAPATAQSIGSGAETVTVQEPIDELTPGVTYLFRVVATNADGTSYGEEETFTAWKHWSTQETLSPEVTELKLTDASCVSATKCAAVGYSGYTEKGFFESWNGEEWTVNKTSLGGGDAPAFSCVGLITCHALATSGGALGTRVYSQSKESGSWTNSFKAFATPAGASAWRLRDVSCSSTSACVAVGYQDTGSGYETLIERYNGSSWSIEAGGAEPAEGNAYKAMSKVSCPPASAYCMAVGEAASQPYAAQWDGGEWSLAPVPDTESSVAVLEDVSCASAESCLAVGHTGKWIWPGWSTIESQPLTEVWDGSEWSEVQSPEASPEPPATDARLSAVSCLSASSCVAVGAFLTEEGEEGKEEKALAEVWDGSEWSVQSATESPATFSALAGVSCTAENQCTAVGSARTSYFFLNNMVTLGERYESREPLASTEAATEVSAEGATLHATVNPRSFDTHYLFEYGTDASYGSTAPAEAEGIGAGTSAVEVSAPIEVEEGETYHFRVVATNAEGVGKGSDRSFTTPAGPPPQCEEVEATVPTGEPSQLSLACSGAGELTYEVISSPEHGSTSELDPQAGTLTYTSEAEFTDTDSFTFAASNAGGKSSPATATINVCIPPEVEVSGEVTEPETPGVNLWVNTLLSEAPCEEGIEEPYVSEFLVYIDGELVYSDELQCEDPEEPCYGGITRGLQLPYAKVIGTHDYRVEAVDQLGFQAGAVEWTETTPEEGTISKIPPEAEDSKGSAGCDTPKNRYKRYVFRGNVVYGTPCADILGKYIGHHTQIYKAGDGDDVIRAGGEINTIFGGGGNDRIYAGRGNDKVFAGAGSDQIAGGSGDDLVKGDTGNDILAGSGGADRVFGGEGDDAISGGSTTDHLYGGSGTNTLSFADAVTPGFEFGEGFLSGFPTSNADRGVYLNLGETPIEVKEKKQTHKYIRAFDGYTARFGGGSDRIYLDGSGFQNVIGSPYADVIVGSGEANLIDGGGGPDIIEGAGGDDQLYGGGDSDLLDGGEGQGAGNLHGGDGDDICVNGTESAQSCERESTEGGLKPTSTSAIVLGRLNPNDPTYDTGIYLRGTNGGDNVTATWDGGHEKEVNDVVKFIATGEATGRFDTSANGVSGCTVAETEATCPLSAVRTLLMDGGEGNDVLKAHKFPAGVAVTVLGGTGRDVLQGGGASEDLLVDGPGAGKDDLYGFGDDDTFFANEGRDRLYGAAGSDLFVSSAACEDRIFGGGDAWDNASWAQLRGEQIGESGQFERPVKGAEVSLPPEAGKVGSIARFGLGCEEDGTIKEVEFLEGSGGEDRLEGNDAHNVILGRSGKDRLIGLDGNDNLLANNRDPNGKTEDERHDPDENLNCGGGADTLRYDKPYDKPAISGTCEEPLGGSATQSALVSGIGSGPTAEGSTASIDEDAIGGAGDPEATPPVAFFRLDEEAGTTAVNWIDEEAPGSYGEGVTFDEPGAVEDSRAIHLNGEGEYVDLTTDWEPSSFDFYSCYVNVNGYSLEMWVKFDSAASGREALFSRSGGGVGLFLYRSGDGRLNFTVDRGIELPTARSDEPVGESEWHHVVATVGFSSQCAGFPPAPSWGPPRMTLYVDGFPYSVYFQYGESPLPYGMPSASNLLGAKSTGSGLADWLNADIDDVAIYGHPLDEGEVQAHMAIGEVADPTAVLVPPVDPEDGDSDEDGVLDSIDNCPAASNPDQEDVDSDGTGNACQSEPDSDSDEVPDEIDNCPEAANKEQTDSDGNGVGDACEST
jgi:Ca2+-binding RTX toxin-like protein